MRKTDFILLQERLYCAFVNRKTEHSCALTMNDNSAAIVIYETDHSGFVNNLQKYDFFKEDNQAKVNEEFLKMIGVLNGKINPFEE